MVKAITDQSQSIMLPEWFETLYSVLHTGNNLQPLTPRSSTGPPGRSPGLVGADRPAYALYYLGKIAAPDGF